MPGGDREETCDSSIEGEIGSILSMCDSDSLEDGGGDGEISVGEGGVGVS